MRAKSTPKSTIEVAVRLEIRSGSQMDLKSELRCQIVTIREDHFSRLRNSISQRLWPTLIELLRLLPRVYAFSYSTALFFPFNLMSIISSWDVKVSRTHTATALERDIIAFGPNSLGSTCCGFTCSDFSSLNCSFSKVIPLKSIALHQISVDWDKDFSEPKLIATTATTLCFRLGVCTWKMRHQFALVSAMRCSTML